MSAARLTSDLGEPDESELRRLSPHATPPTGLPGITRAAVDYVASRPSQRVTPPVRGVKLSLLMCAYNEEETIAQAIEEVLRIGYPCDVELIVVNDGSTDKTAAFLDQVDDPRVIVLHHPSNLGKGAALRSAVAFASGTHILPFDADLEYSSEDVPRLLEHVLNGRCDVVYGARLAGFYTVYRSYRYAVGNRILTGIANLLFNASISDLHTCLKLIPLSMLKSLNLSETGFGLDTEITALLLKRGVRPFEIPVCYFGRSHAQGKKIKWHDAVACLWILLRVRVSSRSSARSISKQPGDGEHPTSLTDTPAPRVRRQVDRAVNDDDGLSVAVTG